MERLKCRLWHIASHEIGFWLLFTEAIYIKAIEEKLLRAVCFAGKIGGK